eukprot:scaffold63399_cov60-Phaeocystis_antarctica.AAC.1
MGFFVHCDQNGEADGARSAQLGAAARRAPRAAARRAVAVRAGAGAVRPCGRVRGAAVSPEATTRLPPFDWGPRVSRDEGGLARRGGGSAACWRRGGGMVAARAAVVVCEGALGVQRRCFSYAQLTSTAAAARHGVGGRSCTLQLMGRPGCGGARVAGPLEERFSVDCCRTE